MRSDKRPAHKSSENDLSLRLGENVVDTSDVEETDYPTAVEIEERRRRERLATRTNGWVFLGDDDHAPSREVVVVDVSRLGVGFIVDTQLDDGMVCRLRMGFGPKRMARRIKVTNCRENEQGGFVIGAEFV